MAKDNNTSSVDDQLKVDIPGMNDPLVADLYQGCADAITAILKEHNIDPGSPEAEDIVQDFFENTQVDDGGRSTRRRIARSVGLFTLGGLTVYGLSKAYKKFAANNDEDGEFRAASLIDTDE